MDLHYNKDFSIRRDNSIPRIEHITINISLDPDSIDRKSLTESLETTLIDICLNQFKWTQEATSKALGITTRTIRNKLSKIDAK